MRFTPRFWVAAVIVAVIALIGLVGPFLIVGHPR